MMVLGEATQYIMDDYEKGAALVTEELLMDVRDLLSSALPRDASEEMIEAFWQAVYDYL